MPRSTATRSMPRPSRRHATRIGAESAGRLRLPAAEPPGHCEQDCVSDPDRERRIEAEAGFQQHHQHDQVEDEVDEHEHDAELPSGVRFSLRALQEIPGEQPGKNEPDEQDWKADDGIAGNVGNGRHGLQRRRHVNDAAPEEAGDPQQAGVEHRFSKGKGLHIRHDMGMVRARLWITRIFLPLVATTLASCATVSVQVPAPAGRQAGIAAANPLAVEAGLEILRAGGSAADAAVAVQAMLGLVEPQSSGLGGGGFMLYYDAASKQVTAFDGRESAPAGATPSMFLDADGAPFSYRDAVVSGRSTGVPGALAMLGVVQKRHGRLPWGELLKPAERAADAGFAVPQRLARFANSTAPLAAEPDVRALFSRADGTPVQAGDI